MHEKAAEPVHLLQFLNSCCSFSSALFKPAMEQPTESLQKRRAGETAADSSEPADFADLLHRREQSLLGLLLQKHVFWDMEASESMQKHVKILNRFSEIT